MAIVAVFTARDVRRMFSGRRCAIVARATGAYDLRMVDSEGRDPGVRVVAVLTNIRRENMRRVLAGLLNAVVAA